MARLFYILLFLGTSWLTGGQENHTIAKSGNIAPDHSIWDGLLKKHVDNDGNVNYTAFKSDLKTLENYLAYLEENAPKEKEDKKNRVLAYYINLYNAATIKLILDNYPLNSIKDISSPWGKKWINLEGQMVSLGHIEHKILRKMQEPRIHFAINCASYSCPKLLNEAFTGPGMEKQLQKATADFIKDKSRNHISAEKVSLSQIFKWYKKDFTENGSLIDYLNMYTDLKLEKDTKIDYLKYDWSLNEVK